MSRRRKILLAVGAFMAVFVAVAGYQGVRALVAWNSIERVDFDLQEARRDLPSTTTLAGATTTVPTTTYQSVLVIGSDERRPNDNSKQVTANADAVLLYLMPDGGERPTIVSIPRDLVVVDPCTGRETKLDRTLEGCGADVSGPELVAIAVEDFAGIPIDHFALINFEALVDMVDSVGGVEMCSEYALREGGVDLLPAGCSIIDGEHALAYIRSRQTQEYVDGEWRFQAETGDAVRVARQQELMFALLDRLKKVRSPVELAGLAEQLGDTIVLSDTLGIGDAVALTWDLRAVSSGAIRTLTVPTEPTVLVDGSFGVRALKPLGEVIAP